MMMHARRTEEAIPQPPWLCCSTMQILQIQEYLAIALPRGPSQLNNIGDTLVATLLTNFHSLRLYSSQSSNSWGYQLL